MYDPRSFICPVAPPLKAVEVDKNSSDLQIVDIANLLHKFSEKDADGEEEIFDSTRISEVFATNLASVLCTLIDKGFTICHQKCKIANILVSSGYLNVKDLLSAQMVTSPMSKESFQS